MHSEAVGFHRIFDENQFITKNSRSMTTQEIANRLVELCRQNKWAEAQEELYAQDCISQEPDGGAWGTAHGMDEIRQKGEKWAAMVEQVHGGEMSDPIVADRFFAVKSVSDVTFKGMGRMQFAELSMYEVKDGKIVKEQFFYTPQQP